MALYTTLASLSQTAASNAADGSADAPSTIDNQLNLLASFIAQIRDGNGFTAQLGTRNRVINGNFAVNQRGVSGTVTLAAGVYGHDRWKAGAAGCTYTFTTSGLDTTITISAGSLQQVIEGAYVEGGTYTMSWSGTAQGKINGGAFAATGVQATGVTAGANVTVEFGIGSITRVQVESNSTASQFERRPISYEEMLCKRYFQAITTCIRQQALNAGQAMSQGISFPVTMRAAPTLTNLIAGSALNATGSQLNFTKIGFQYDIIAGAAGDSFVLNWVYGLSAEL